MKTDLQLETEALLSTLTIRSIELSKILPNLSWSEIADTIAYATFKHQTVYLSQSAMVKELIPLLRTPYHVEFDDDLQEKAFTVLEKCYDVRCGEYGFLLGDHDIIAGLAVATEASYEVCEKFFNQHYTKQGVIR